MRGGEERRVGEERSIGEEKGKRSEEKVVLNDESSRNPGHFPACAL